jgi:peptide deformylase
MSLLTILRYPDPRLNKVAKPVAHVDDRLRQLVIDMFETMYKSRGIGLAATQVDVHERLIVIDVSEDKSDQLVLINPAIIAHSEERVVSDEGCLSVPSIYDKVERYATVRVRAKDREGQTYEFDAEGLLAVCVQHEMDHLMGKVFVEYLSPLKRNRIRSKLVKRQREDEDEDEA